jgi:type I restriction enzyme S subunit
MYPLRSNTSNLRDDFVFWYLLSEGFTCQAVSYQSRTGIPKINRLQLNQIPFPMPDVEVQSTICGYLDAVDQKIAAEEAYRDALASLFDSLLYDLMTATLRVTDLIQEVA